VVILPCEIGIECRFGNYDLMQVLRCPLEYGKPPPCSHTWQGALSIGLDGS